MTVPTSSCPSTTTACGRASPSTAKGRITDCGGLMIAENSVMPSHPQVGDGEAAPLELVLAQLTGARAFGELRHRSAHLCEGESLDRAQNRGHQPAIDGYRHRHVDCCVTTNGRTRPTSRSPLARR